MTERRWFAALAIVTGLGALFRIVDLNRLPGLNPDEVEVVLQWFRDPIVPWYVAPSGRPLVNPLGPVLLWPFATFANPAPWVVRAPAVLMGLALLPTLFYSTARVFGRLAAISATMLAASAPILIAYSRLGWDAAYVPALTALAIGAGFARRRALAISASVLLVLVHPTALFVLVVVASPFVQDWWRQAGKTPAAAWRRTIICAIFTIAGVLAALSIAASSEEIPLHLNRVPEILGLVAPRVTDGAGLLEFASGYLQAMKGALIYAGFASAPVPVASPWSVVVVGLCATAGAALLARQRRTHELTVLVALTIGLGAQYVSQGPDVASAFRERYLLWSVVPSLLGFVFIVQAVCRTSGIERWTPALALGLSGVWMSLFFSGYVQPLRRTGGTSAVLDYRTSSREPKVMALDAVRRSRQHPESPAVVFAGEARLELGLVYLASRDSVQVRNLGRVLYTYYQRDDRGELMKLYSEPAGTPRDIFFVDYDWDRLPGVVREVHTRPARSVAEAVAPWVATPLEEVPAADGRPLLRIWRLSRPPQS